LYLPDFSGLAAVLGDNDASLPVFEQHVVLLSFQYNEVFHPASAEQEAVLSVMQVAGKAAIVLDRLELSVATGDDLKSDWLGTAG
jgi:hypothetical protein